MKIYGRQGARKSLLHTVAFRAISQVATVLSYVVMVRGMAERDFGIFNLLYGFIPVVSTIASLGLEQTLRRYQPEYLRSGNLGAAHWVVRTVASARFGTNLLVIGVLLLTWEWVAPIFQLHPYRFEFALFSLLIVLFFQSRILQLSLASHMMHRYSVGSLALVPIVKFVLYLGLWISHRFTLEAAIVADIIANAIAYVMLRIVHQKHCRGQTRAVAPSRDDQRRMLRYGLYNNFNDVGSVILGTRSDNFFIAALMNAVSVGAYAFYVRLNEMVNNLSPSRLFDNVIEPVFFAIPPEHAAKRIPRYFTLMLNLNLPLQWAALAYTMVYHHEIVATLFAGKFIEWSPLLPVVMAFGATGVIATPVTLVAQYEERASIILLSKIVVIYQVIATLTFIPVAGLYGAAIATGTATLFKNLIIWWYVRRTARWLNFTSMLTMTLLIWGGAVGVCLLLKHVVPLPALAHMVIGALVCAIAGLLYLRSPAITASDRQILGEVLHGREARLLRWIGLAPTAAASAS